MRSYRPLLAVTLLAVAAVLFWGLGSLPLMSYNEARRAVPASVMFSTGDWLIPRLNGEPYLAKPPLLYWLAASSSHVLGSASEWAVRLPSAIAALATVAIAFVFALRRFGPWAALFAVQVLIANAGFSSFARRAEIEMLLAALCFGALLAALRFSRGDGARGWLWLSYGLLGAAVLTKGPLALLFVTLPLLADALLGRQPRQWQALGDPVGWLLFLVVGSSWYLAVTWAEGVDVWRAIVAKDIVAKVAGSAGDPVFMYCLWLLADFFPASVLFLVRPVSVWRRWRGDRRIVPVVLAVALPLLVFSAFSNKHAKYLLPVYPWLAILLGKRLGEIYEASRPFVRRALLAAGLALPVGYAVFFAVAEARVFDYRFAAFAGIREQLAGAGRFPLYGTPDVDERLPYYAGRDIPAIDAESVAHLRQAATAFVLLAEQSRGQVADWQADCLLAEFKPYLKKGKALGVYGYGEACADIASGGK